MLDPQLTKVFNAWFDAFGSQWLRVHQLMDRAPLDLRMLILRYAPDKHDRHAISRPRVGRWLCRLSRGPAISGWHMQARRASHQMTFSLTEAVLDKDLHNPVARPSGACAIKIAPGTHPRDALEQSLNQARNAVLAAVCSGDANQVSDAQEFLEKVEEAAEHFLNSYKVSHRVESAWARRA